MLLFYLSDLSYTETAAQLGIEVRAVKTRLNKARSTLRRRLRALWEEQPVTDASALQPPIEPPVRMRVVDVRRTPAVPDRPARHVVALEEIGGGRTLLIPVGQFEGTALAVLLEKAETGPHSVLRAVPGRTPEGPRASGPKSSLHRLVRESTYRRSSPATEAARARRRAMGRGSRLGHRAVEVVSVASESRQTCTGLQSELWISSTASASNSLHRMNPVGPRLHLKPQQPNGLARTTVARLRQVGQSLGSR